MAAPRATTFYGRSAPTFNIDTVRIGDNTTSVNLEYTGNISRTEGTGCKNCQESGFAHVIVACKKNENMLLRKKISLINANSHTYENKLHDLI